MTTDATHFGVSQDAAAACGRRAVVVTGDPRAVTCQHCRESEDFTSAWEMVEVIESLPEASETEPDVITALRKAVANFSMVKWDGIAIDIQSANAVVTVYDALNDASKAKLAAMPVDRMALIAWKLISSKH